MVVVDGVFGVLLGGFVFYEAKTVNLECKGSE